MKYKIIKSEIRNTIDTSIVVTFDNENFMGFSIEIGNPNYDQFLKQTGLTDTEVHELEPNVWHDFPELPTS